MPILITVGQRPPGGAIPLQIPEGWDPLQSCSRVINSSLTVLSNLAEAW